MNHLLHNNLLNPPATMLEGLPVKDVPPAKKNSTRKNSPF